MLPLIKKLGWLLTLFIVSSISCANSTLPPKKTYPPYPEVWGYDLSEFPAFKWGAGGVQAYRMDDGDIWFIVTYSYKNKNPMNYFAPKTDTKYVLIKFFKGEQTEISTEERKKLYDITKGKDISAGFLNTEDILFSDGSELKINYRFPAKSCTIPDFFLNKFIKTDKNGKEKTYSILAASPQVDVRPDKAECEAQGAPFLYQKLYVLTNLINLNDDTFIAFTGGSNLILRFDKNLNTKFEPVTPVTIYGNYIMRNFFVIDYSLIETLKNEYIQQSVPLYQSIHDALLLHFHDLYPDSE